jgi:hypothetical protein
VSGIHGSRVLFLQSVLDGKAGVLQGASHLSESKASPGSVRHGLRVSSRAIQLLLYEPARTNKAMT